MHTSSLVIRSGMTAGKLIVYGSPQCGWTKKQLEHLDGKKMPYEFVDCTQQQCPSFVDGFPTLDQDGKIMVGYQKL